MHPMAQLPSRQTSGAAGYDIRACLENEITIDPGMIAAIPTGLALAIPEGYHLSIRPRSGLALKYGITMINSPGTVDSDYRGEIKILLVNHGKLPFTVRHGDRIGQGLIEKVYSAEFIEGELDVTARAEGGFGSTGI